MKKYIMSLLILIAVTKNVIAQFVVLNASSTSPTFSVTPPPGFPSCTDNCFIDMQPTARSCVFLEYGDGRFTDDFLKSYRPVNNTNSNSLNALMTFRGKYDGGNPKGRVIFQRYTIGQNNIATEQKDIPESKEIMIRSDVSDLLENDTIQVVITYKKTFKGTGKILFYYNDQLKSFDIIGSNMVTPAGDLFPQVRIYNAPATYCQQVKEPRHLDAYTCFAAPDANSLIYGVNSTERKTYSNVAVFALPETPKFGEENNLFITLHTNGAPKSAILALTSLRAYIIADETMNSGSRIDDTSPLFSELTYATIPYDPNEPGALRPHDPNYIIAKKKCLIGKRCVSIRNRFVPKMDTIDYKVHFQNDGMGSADSITVVVDFLTTNFNRGTVRMVSAKVGHKKIQGLNLETITSGNLPSIKFILKNLQDPTIVELLGGGMLPTGNADQRTMGELHFTITTTSSLPCYRARARIYFNNELPVTTKISSIRYCEDRPVEMRLKCGQYLPCDYKPGPVKTDVINKSQAVRVH